jgi:hypothetical protein
MKRCRPGTHTTCLVHPPGALHLGLGLQPPCAGHRFESEPCLRHPPFSQCNDDPTRDGAVHELRAYRLARHRPACTVAPVFAAPHPTVMHVTVLGGTSGRAGAALLLAAAAASVRDAVGGGVLGRRAGSGALRRAPCSAGRSLGPTCCSRRAGSGGRLRARCSGRWSRRPPCCSRRAGSGALRRARCSAQCRPTLRSLRSPRARTACRLRARRKGCATLRALRTPRAGSGGPCPHGTCEARPTPAQA